MYISGLSRHFGLKFIEAIGVFFAGLSTPILVLKVLYPCFSLFNNYFYKNLSLNTQIFIWDWDFNLGRKEFGI